MPPIPDNPALFLDFDGTLVEFASEPDAIDVPSALVALLDRVHSAVGGAMAMVTGRSVDNLAGHIGHDRFAAAGVHGAEWRLAGGDMQHVSGDGFETEAAAAQAFVDSNPDAFIEHKSGGVTLHFRRCPELKEAALGVLSEAFDPRDDFEILAGNMMWEARRKGVNKGAAIRRLMKHHPFAGRTPIFIGDDVTDEDGFAAVNDLGGRSFKVGDGETGATHRFAGIGDVHEWLGRLADLKKREKI